jgi:hypothetical protein
MSDQEVIVSMLIDEARGQIGAGLANADSHDNKALALLGVDVAAIIGIITLHTTEVTTAARSPLDRWWGLLLIGSAMSAAAFLATVSNRAFWAGPAVDRFYAKHIHEPGLIAQFALLTDLNIAITHNADALTWKRGTWYVGFVLMTLTAGLGIVLLVVVH